MRLTTEPTQYCDHCGDEKPVGDLYHYEALPWDIYSENKGGSGSVCHICHDGLESGVA